MSDGIRTGFGRQLTEAREAREMTIAQVAEKLKLTVRQIEALEAEDMSRLPEPIFVRGFIRNYARLLEISPDHLPMVAETDPTPTETITAHSEELRFSASPVKRWLLLPMGVLGLFVLLVVVLYAWLSQGEEAYVPDQHGVPSEPIIQHGESFVPQALTSVVPPAEEMVTTAAPELPSPVEPSTAPAQPATAPATTPPAASMPAKPAPVLAQPPAVPSVPPANQPTVPSAPIPATSKPEVRATGAPSTLPISTPAQPYSPPAPRKDYSGQPAGRTIQLVAEQTDTWVEVLAGDNKRFSRLLKVGEQLSLQGTPPFRLVVGNAAGARLSYEGRPIDLKPHTGAKVARLTLE